MVSSSLKSLLNEAQTELQEMKDFSSVHKRRVQDMLANILRDLSEVGSVMGGGASDFKASFYLLHWKILNLLIKKNNKKKYQKIIK